MSTTAVGLTSTCKYCVLRVLRGGVLIRTLDSQSRQPCVELSSCRFEAWAIYRYRWICERIDIDGYVNE